MMISCKDLTKKFGEKTALKGVGFQIEDNSITGLIGRNGSGKTTFMRMASGLIIPTSGELEVMGMAPYGTIGVAENVIYSFHNYPHPPKMKLQDIKEYYKAMFPNFDNEFACNLMKYYSLDYKMKYSALSQGMMSMFNYSMALAARSPITFLDEPMLGMDAKTRKHAYEILLTEYSLHPRNFIISSHMLNEFDTILSDIILIDQGKLIFHKELDEVSQMAFRVDGDEGMLQEMTAHMNVLHIHVGEVQNFYIVEGALTEQIKAKFKVQNLECSMLRPEDICIYYSSQKREEDLSCLWNEKN
ncbi:MAG: ABC transporter ATP-binding protein [Eubacteriales bacterium]